MTITSTSSANQLWQLLQASSTTPATSTSGSTGTSTISDSSQLSDPGKLFSELQSLAKSNPTEFKKITAELASKLSDAASQSTNPSEANMLKQMASNFDKASQSGSFSDLFSSSSSSASSTGDASSAPPPPGHSHYGKTQHAGSSTLESLFSQALQQIQTDLQS